LQRPNYPSPNENKRMKTSIKLTAVAMFLASVALGADRVSSESSIFEKKGLVPPGSWPSRIDHPNGPPTFAYGPIERKPTTVAVYAGERGLGQRALTHRGESGGKNVLKLHRGRADSSEVSASSR
jgi:hypothetical protein